MTKDTVDLTDLLTDPVLHLVLHTPTDPDRLGRSVSWCAPTELLDPSAYLTTNTLVLTTGMGLNFQDPRTWDAYVERLARVPVAGLVFSTGDAHQIVPEGLVEAATTRGVPVLELIADAPTLLLLRHVESALASERFRTAQRTWDLADSCARLALEGGDITALLDHLESFTGGPVALTDATGAPLFTSRNWHGWVEDRTTVRRLPLPGDLTGECFLVIPSPAGRDLAGPAAAVIAMHVSQALGGATSSAGAAQPFVDALLTPGATAKAVDDAVEASGLDPTKPTLALCVNLDEPPTRSSAAPQKDPQLRRIRYFQLWRIQSLLETLECTVRQAEHSRVQVLVAQGEELSNTDSVDKLYAQVCATVDGHRIGGAMTAVGSTPQQLKTFLPTSVSEARSSNGIVRAGDRTLLDLVARSAPIGAHELARELIDRLHRGDPSGVLVSTLEAVVRCAGQRTTASTALGIHRNTLSARLQRIHLITGWDLANGETLAALAVALRLIRT